MSFQLTDGRFKAFDSFGAPLVGGQLLTYVSGTTTPKATFTDATLATPNATTITLNARGEAQVWLGLGAYTFVLKDSTGVTIWSADGVIDGQSASAAALQAYIDSLAEDAGTQLVGFRQTGVGAASRTAQSKMRDEVNANDFGAIGDGSSHPLSSITTYNGVSTVGWTLTQWQSVFPHAVSRSDEIDWCGWQAAINAINPYVFNATFNDNQGGGTVRGKRGVYLMSRSLLLAAHVTLAGDGSQTYMAQATPTGAPDGLIFMPVSSGFVGVAVIDSTGYVVATGQRYVSATPLNSSAFTGGTVTYTEGCGLRDLAVKPNGTTGLIGIRMQGSPGCKVKNVSAQGFSVNSQGICCWNSEWDMFNPGGVQISGYFQECHSSRVSGEFDNAVTSGVGNGVTSGNKPACWSAVDTVYVSTSLYLVNNLGLEIPSACSQHTGGSYIENSHVHFGTWYNEDHGLSNPQDESAYVTGAAMLRANNGSVSTTPSASPGTTPNIVIDLLMSTANGSTAFDSIYNANILLMALGQPSGGAGVGILYGSHTSTGQALYLGPGVVRNGNFPDLAFDSRQINMFPVEGTWTPVATNLGGTGITYQARWIKVGNQYQCDVVINGTSLTATAVSTSITLPFNGTAGFGPPNRPSTVAVSVASLAAVGAGQVRTDANLYLPTIASTTQIVLSFSVFLD